MTDEGTRRRSIVESQLHPRSPRKTTHRNRKDRTIVFYTSFHHIIGRFQKFRNDAHQGQHRKDFGFRHQGWRSLATTAGTQEEPPNGYQESCQVIVPHDGGDDSKSLWIMWCCRSGRSSSLSSSRREIRNSDCWLPRQRKPHVGRGGVAGSRVAMPDSEWE